MKNVSILTVALICNLCPMLLHAAEADMQKTNAIPEIVVTASRRELLLLDKADIVQIIDRNQIEKINPSTTGELLEHITGTARSTGTGSGLPDRSVISVNGLPPKYTLVLLDGVPLITDHIHTGQNIDLIPASNIERIEVMRGAASAQYGTDAIGGIVNVITRKRTDRKEGTLAVSVGDYNTYEGNLSILLPVGKTASMSSFVDWEKSDGLPLKAPVHRIDNTGYDRLTLFNRVDASLSDTTDAFLWLNYVNNNMDWRGDTANSILVTPVVGFTHEVTPSLNVAEQVSYSDWDAEVNSERNRLLKPEANVAWQLGETHTLMSGGEYRWNEFSRRAIETSEQQAYALFLQDEWIASDYFTMMSAVRYDDVEGVEGAVSPKFSMMYVPMSRMRIRASVGRGFHAPTLQELYEEGYGHGGSAYRFGNPDLDPEYSTTYTAGLEGQPTESVKVMLYGYYSDLDDMIVPVYEGPWDEDPAIDVWRRQNIKNAEVYGIEASAKVSMGKHVSFDAGYTYTENQDKDTGRQLPYSPGSTVYGNMTVTAPVFGKCDIDVFLGVLAGFDREAWNWKPASDVEADNPDGLTTKLKDYTKLDAGVTLHIADMYDIFVKVENILGEDIENLDDVYTVLDGEPFVRVGVKYRFPFPG